MHNSLSDEDYSKIIYDLKDDHKELIYFLYLRDFTTSQLAALRNQSDRNIRGVRSTILGQIEKKVLMIPVDRQGEGFPFTNGNFTMEELDVLLRHEEEIPATMEKLDKEKLVLTAINLGTAAMNKADEAELKEAIMDFVSEYGMLGLMTALPTTPNFITYEAVYLPKNHFIKEESISTEKYLSYFFPFDKIDFRKKGMESSWSTDCVEMIALIMTMKNKPQAVMMSFQQEYAEPYEWLV